MNDFRLSRNGDDIHPFSLHFEHPVADCVPAAADSVKPDSQYDAHARGAMRCDELRQLRHFVNTFCTATHRTASRRLNRTEFYSGVKRVVFSLP